MEGFSSEQVRRGKRCRELYHKLGAPGMGNFKAIIKGNLIKICPVNHKEINVMNEIWGKDIVVLKGKTVYKTPRRITENMVDIPWELYRKNNKIMVHMDIFYVNRLGFWEQ